jgi:hypothetical protein
VAPFAEELKECPDGFGHVHGIGPFWFPAPEREPLARPRSRGRASEPFPVASAEYRQVRQQQPASR